jgi:hypothetical protein
LIALAQLLGIPTDNLTFPDPLAYRYGMAQETLAGIYSSWDVMLATSYGEGFGIPTVEAQACGVPVIVSNFAASPELVGDGWVISGQPLYDPAQHSFWHVPSVPEIVEALERAISREGFKMRSVRLHNELKKFVYKNGKPDHMKGSHDDLIMALGMCLFVANNSFRKLSESVNSTKAMIDSWKVNTNNIQTTSNTMLQEATKLVTENNYGQNNDIYGNNNDTMKNTLEFSWLFGNIKKK